MTAPRTLTRRSDPPSSFAAAVDHVGSGRHVSQKQHVLEKVRALPGMTSAEYARVLRLSRYVVARRLPDLEREGQVMRGALRTCQAHGNVALTWFPCEPGGQFSIPFPVE